jgi:hypothetical protein
MNDSLNNNRLLPPYAKPEAKLQEYPGKQDFLQLDLIPRSSLHLQEPLPYD